MAIAKVFRSGNSQAVRLPKQFRFKSKEVEIFRRGEEIVLRERRGAMRKAFDLLAGLPDDFDLSVPDKRLPQEREEL
ncbi:MAG TPA: type II toxin-antitoxin system VapB family antitoxin [Terriglobales bacterium]|nr:type II toxin-antitoxin system VapB family antitoxin [Terriglobales bacterium]